MPGGRQILREEVRNDRGKICRKQFSLGGGCLRTRAKWSFSIFQTIVKMMEMERARQDEDVGVGFTSNGVTVKKIRVFKTQGLIYKNASTNRSLAVSNGRAFSDIRLRSGETASRLGVFTYPRGEDWVKGQRRGRALGLLPGGVAGPAWPGQRPTWPSPSSSRQKQGRGKAERRRRWPGQLRPSPVELGPPPGAERSAAPSWSSSRHWGGLE